MVKILWIGSGMSINQLNELKKNYNEMEIIQGSFWSSNENLLNDLFRSCDVIATSDESLEKVAERILFLGNMPLDSFERSKKFFSKKILIVYGRSKIGNNVYKSWQRIKAYKHRESGCVITGYGPINNENKMR